MRSPKSNNLIKVKTSYKLKVSAEKIVTTNNIVKDDKRKRKEYRPESGEFEYFLGRSKDLKKMKKTVEGGMNLPSPRVNHTSRSSSKR